MFYFNPMMWGMHMNNNMLVYFLIAMTIPLLAQGYLMSTFGRYKRTRASSGLTGYEVARRILDGNGLYDVQIEETQGRLSDHYDPRTKTVRLSPDIYRKPSVAAVSVAAHEVGHALQHAQNYMPLTLRSALVPVVSVANRLGFLAIMLGIFLQLFMLAEIGILLIASLFVFQLITLPVEFNASRRAMVAMGEMNILHDSTEKRGARQVLTAAALTYVAALIVTLMELLRWVAILNGSRGRRR
ncbi:MAG: zinc metallopeptidase [Defluviitaleaceae bacterium]|nr:zinc metallopeptidase [Defluviitaleaceae bacterium]